MYAWPVADAIVVVAALIGGSIWLIATEIGTEFHGPFTRWWSDRIGFTDTGQTKHVRKYAVGLGSPVRNSRLHSARMLGDLNDASAVPSLIRAAEKYRNDGRFLEVVVQSLETLADSRAVPVLRKLSMGRHQTLMASARRALAAIEPASVLLRPAKQSNDLLRPAGSAHRAAELLRPANEPNVQDISVRTGNR